MNNISKVIKFIGIILVITSYILKVFDNCRLFVLVLGILFITISLIIKNRNKKIILVPLLLIIITYVVDVLLVYTLNTYPIYSKKIKSTDNFIVYNSLGYRMFECDDKKYKDLFYKKSNYCDYNELEEKDVNVFSSEIVSSFNQYKNKFIVLSGKVSYKEGNNYIELKSYNNENNDINGNVIFNENIVYKFKFNNLNNIDNLKLYDNVKIVGRVSEIQNIDDIYTIVIKDAYIPDVKIYNNYKINVVEDKKCQKDKTNYVSTKENDFYTSCLTNIYVIFNDEEVYELNYVLKDEKITTKDLLSGYKDVEEKEVDKIINKLYIFDKYKILVCGNNKNIIIGNKKLNMNNNYCEVSDIDNNEL